MQAMAQVNMQLDQRNTSMTPQQSLLQVATMGANSQQLQHLTNHLGNLGTEVGKAIASHPARIQATLSHPSAIPGQSNDPRQLGSLTCPIPVGMSVQGFDYSPYVQAFQPQPNDKNTLRIDKATHQIVQRHLPLSVKVQHNAAHTSGVALPVGDFIRGFVYVVETRVGMGHRIIRRYYWHCTFGTGCITLSGFMLQPNIQERDFGPWCLDCSVAGCICCRHAREVRMRVCPCLYPFGCLAVKGEALDDSLLCHFCGVVATP